MTVKMLLEDVLLAKKIFYPGFPYNGTATEVIANIRGQDFARACGKS